MLRVRFDLRLSVTIKGDWVDSISLIIIIQSSITCSSTIFFLSPPILFSIRKLLDINWVWFMVYYSRAGKTWAPCKAGACKQGCQVRQATGVCAAITTTNSQLHQLFPLPLRPVHLWTPEHLRLTKSEFGAVIGPGYLEPWLPGTFRPFPLCVWASYLTELYDANISHCR